MAAERQSDKYTVRWRFKTGGDTVAVRVSAEGDIVAAGSTDGLIYVLDACGGLLWKTGLGGMVMGVSIVKQRQTIIAGSRENGRLSFLDVKGRLLDTWDLGRDFALWNLDATDDCQYIVVGGSPGGVRLLDGAGRRQIWQFDGESHIWHVGLCREAGRIIAASRHGCAILLDWEGRLVWKYHGSNDFIGAAISADGSIIVAGDADSIMHCLNADKSIRWRFDTKGKILKGMALTPGGEYLVAAAQSGEGGKGSVYLLDTSGAVLWEHLVDRNAQDVAITPDGRFVVASTQTGEVLLLENLLPAVGYSVVKDGPFAGATARAHVVRRSMTGASG